MLSKLIFLEGTGHYESLDERGDWPGDFRGETPPSKLFRNNIMISVSRITSFLPTDESADFVGLEVISRSGVHLVVSAFIS